MRYSLREGGESYVEIRDGGNCKALRRYGSLGFIIYWRKRHKKTTNLTWLAAGMIGFIVSARALELGMHYICIVPDNAVSRFINGSTVAFALYGTAMACIFEECGRYIVLKHIMKKNRSLENAVLYGIGHGGIEILAVLLPVMILYLAIAVLFRAGDASSAAEALKITEDTAGAALPSVRAAASFDFAMMAMNVLERVLAMLMHTGLTVIVYYGLVRKRKAYLPVAVILHMTADTLPALYQRGVVPLWMVEVWGAAITEKVVFIAVKRYKRGKTESPAGCIA